jgi:predicted alpha/beta-fold hydrolase
MPYLLPSDYQPPRLLTNGHAQTIYAAMLRRVTDVEYRRERIDTLDGDFLDLDISEIGAGPVAILVHGLEGSAQQTYMLGMTRALNARNVNVVCVNLRGCSGEANRHLKSYDMGSTGDIALVVAHVAKHYPGEAQFLVGFSLGGNLVLKYLGELGESVSPQIVRAVAFSVPCDLKSTAEIISSSSNRLYYHRFMLSIQMKVRVKDKMFPGQIHPKAKEWADSFKQFDEYFTAPILGFESAEQYWEKASCMSVLSEIRVPTLLVSAKDDPLISSECFPMDIAAQSTFLHLETPEHGGHVAFVSFNADGEYWSEKRAAMFLIHGK